MNFRNGKSKPDLYVVSRIIKTLMDDGPLKKTNLATNAGLSYDNMVTYVEWMLSKELVSEGESMIHITNKGIKAYNELVSWIIDYVGQLKFGKNI